MNVRVCMCMYVYICMHVSTYVYMCLRLHTRLDMYMYLCAHTYSTYIHTYIQDLYVVRYVHNVTYVGMVTAVTFDLKKARSPIVCTDLTHTYIHTHTYTELER